MRVEQRQQPLAVLRRQVAEEVGLLVGRHRVDQAAGVGQVELADDARAVVLQLGLVQHPHRHLERERRQQGLEGRGRFA